MTKLEAILTGITVLLAIFLSVSVEFNIIGTFDKTTLRAREQVYRMQIEHYNPKDYLLQIEEVR